MSPSRFLPRFSPPEVLPPLFGSSFALPSGSAAMPCEAQQIIAPAAANTQARKTVIILKLGISCSPAQKKLQRHFDKFTRDQLAIPSNATKPPNLQLPSSYFN